MGLDRVKPGIFVSYAHVNDQSLSRGQPGWVTTLVRQLAIRLTMRSGRDSFELWTDHKLRGGEPVTGTIQGQVDAAAVLVVFLSRGYLESEWCLEELRLFHEASARRGQGNARVFVVEFHEVDRPQVLKDQLHFPFWKKDMTGTVRTLGFPRISAYGEAAYHALLDKLSQDLADKLEDMRPATVYLAEAAEDPNVNSWRETVKQCLKRLGYGVRPLVAYPRDLDLASFRAAVEADLADATLFVQLLCEEPGRRYEGSDWRSVRQVHDIAARRRPALPILQWRSRQIDWTKVPADSPHHALLDGKDVMEVDLIEFQGEIKRYLAKPKAPQTTRVHRSGPFFFINAHESDETNVRSITEQLRAWSIGHSRSVSQDKPAMNREDLDRNILDCDAMMVIYGEADAKWARAQLERVKQLVPRRSDGYPPLALIEAPPEETKVDLGYFLPRMKILDCRNRIDQEKLKGFIEGLQQASDGD